MKLNVMMLLLGLGALLFSKNSWASALDFSCDVPLEKKDLKCSGNFKARNLSELNLYKTSLGLKNNKAQNLDIDFDVTGSNLILSSPCKISLKEDKKILLSGNLCLHGSLGVAIKEDTQIMASKVTLESSDEVKIDEDANIEVSSLKIEANKCKINDDARIDAGEELGVCLLKSDPKDYFSVDKKSGTIPLTITFDASKLLSKKDITKLVWQFGDGTTLETQNAITSHTYTNAGEYVAKLFYEKNKKLKPAGEIKISANRPQGFPPVADLSCLVNNLLVNCNGLASFDPDNQPLTFTFNYSDGFIETNTSGLSTHAYALPGLYNVLLTVTDLSGLSNTKTISVQAVLPPNLIPIPKLACTSPKPHTLSCSASESTDEDGNIVSFQYQFDDGSIESRADGNEAVFHTFSNGGSHTVALIVTDNDGGVGTITQSFVTLQNTNPVANFTCTSNDPYQISCESISTDPDSPLDELVEYKWSLNNETITQFSNASLNYNFNRSGVFPVILQVKDSYGGVSSITKNITVKDNILPVADLYASKISGNIPLEVNFEARNVQDVDGSIASIEWDFSDGESASGESVSHTFTTAGTYTVILKVTDNLGGVVTKMIDITATTPPVILPEIGFIPLQDGSTTIDLRAKFTKTQYDLVQGYFTIDDTTTVPVQVSNDYNLSRTAINLQSYGVHKIALSVIDSKGNIATTSQNINLSQTPTTLSPVANLKWTQTNIRSAFLNANLSYTPHATSSITNYRFEFGDGTFINSTSAYALHAYQSAGTYTASVTVTNTQGATSTITAEVTVTDEATPIQKPIANFGYQVNSWAQNVNFYVDRSGTPNGSIISYAWDFGDGSTGTGSQIAHFFDPGNYIVKLTVTDSAGESSSQSQLITVTQPGSNLAMNIDCGTSSNPLQTCLFTALDRYNQISQVRVFWGDGGSTILTTPANPAFGIYGAGRRYTTGGNKIIQLQVSTSRGETRSISITKNIIIPPPVAVINCSINNLKLSCNSSGSSDPSGAGIASYTWNLGNGQIIQGPTQSFIGNYVYPQPGTYTVSLTIRSNSGLQTTTSTQVTATNGYPIAALQCQTNNLLVTCNALGSFDPENGALTFSFDYADGYVEVNQTGFSSHAYTSAGLRTVRVTVTDDFGNTNTASTQVMPVFPPESYPVADFECTSNLPLSVTCFDRSSDSDGGVIVSRILTFDNGEEVSLSSGSIFYQFTAPGEHSATLAVIDNDGLTGTATKTFVVKENQNPIASLECQNSGPQKIMCYSTAIDPDNGDQLIDFSWDFGDGNIESGLIGTSFHTYAQSGTYTVRMTVKDQFGGVGVSEVEITTQENLPPVATIDCENSGLKTISCHTFAYDPDVGLESITWLLSDGTQFTGTNFTHTFLDAGVYTVTLKVRDLLGKEMILTDNIDVLDNKRPTFDLYSDSTQGHLPLTVNFEAQNAVDPDGTIVSFEWFINNESVATTPSLSHIFEETGIYNVKVRVIDNYNGMTEKSVTIGASHPSNIVINSNLETGVANLNVHFDGSESSDPEGSIIKYEWSYQGEKFAEGNNTDYEFDIAGDQYVELTVTNNYGVETTLAKTINVTQPPIYLDGIIADRAFVGREYKAILDTVLEESIVPENVSYELIGAPSGVSFDQETMTLTWIPTIEQKGEVLFYLNATDGVLNHRRKFKISVYELELIGNVNMTARGGTYFIDADNSPLDGTQVILPENDESYALNLYQALADRKIILHAESSTFLRKPIELEFNKELNLEYRVTESDFLDDGDHYTGPSLIQSNTDSLILCVNSFNAYSMTLGYENKKYSFFNTINNARIFGEAKNFNNPNFLNIVSILHTIFFNVSGLKIYITDSIGNDYGFHHAGSTNTFFINLNTGLFSTNKNDAFRKYVLKHEGFHVAQTQTMGCMNDFTAGKRPTGLKNIIEGSADYFALQNLTSKEHEDILKIEYADFKDTPYTIAKSSIGKGLLRSRSDRYFKPYYSRAFGDFFNFHSLVFFKNYGEDPNLTSKNNADVLRILKLSLDGDISEELFKLTDLFYNYHSTYPGFLSSKIKNLSLFPKWISIEAENENKAVLDNLIPHSATIKLDIINAISGVSKNFSLETLSAISNPSEWNSPMSIQLVSNNADLKMEVYLAEFSGDTRVNVINFENTGKISRLTLPTHATLTTRKVFINIINASAEDVQNVRLQLSF